MSQNHKKRIAVLFGGRSPEHDVSIVTGLQILGALDSTKYDAFPVYVTPSGAWLTGDVLRERKNYFLNAAALAQTTAVTLDVTTGGGGRLIPLKSGFLKTPKPIVFDAAIPSFHGINAEDGTIQGLLETAGIPYAGMRVMASALCMDKFAAKKMMQALDIPVLPCAVLRRPETGYMIAPSIISETLRAANIGFPCVIKPSHLGSSIGVAKAENADEIAACLPAAFEFDDTVIVEPFVPNLVEYNVAVARMDGRIVTSAIERPKSKSELLDFKAKYLSSGGGKGTKTSGTKTPGNPSQGMLSLTRELNPPLPPQIESNIRNWSSRLYVAIDGTGAPRIDFIGNASTGEIWMNEVNPWPGSIGYFLWEAAPAPLLFAELLDHLINEALARRRAAALPHDPVPVGARLFSRAG